MDKKLSPNNKSINNKSNNDLNRARGTPAAYGRYGNVFLSESDYRELQEEIPGLDNLIEQLSGYMKSRGNSTQTTPPPCAAGRQTNTATGQPRSRAYPITPTRRDRAYDE